MIRARLETLRRTLAERLPAPMASPETPVLRGRRMRTLTLLALLTLATLIEPWFGALAPVSTALVWLALAFATLLQGSIWIVAKLAADAAWLDHLGQRDDPE